MRLTCVIPGEPVPKPRQTRRDRWEQRPAVVRYRTWADAARLAYRAACRAQRLRASEFTPEGVHANFYLPAPKSAAGRNNFPHTQKPDLDNLVKAVLDALFPDGDQRIYLLTASKRWDDGNGARVELSVDGRKQTL